MYSLYSNRIIMMIILHARSKAARETGGHDSSATYKYIYMFWDINLFCPFNFDTDACRGDIVCVSYTTHAACVNACRTGHAHHTRSPDPDNPELGPV
jgi:hypothetical protein